MTFSVRFYPPPTGKNSRLKFFKRKKFEHHKHTVALGSQRLKQTFSRTPGSSLSAATMFAPIIRRNWAGLYASGLRFNSTASKPNNQRIIDALKVNSKPTRKNTFRDLAADSLVANTPKISTDAPSPSVFSPRFNSKIMDQAKELKRHVEAIPLFYSRSKLQVSVKKGASSLSQDLKQLNRAVSRNRIPHELRAQRFYVRPSKKKRLDRSVKHRQQFKEGIKRLLNVVKDARRKGY